MNRMESNTAGKATVRDGALVQVMNAGDAPAGAANAAASYQ